jgi:hypothetical protein
MMSSHLSNVWGEPVFTVKADQLEQESDDGRSAKAAVVQDHQELIR